VRGGYTYLLNALSLSASQCFTSGQLSDVSIAKAGQQGATPAQLAMHRRAESVALSRPRTASTYSSFAASSYSSFAASSYSSFATSSRHSAKCASQGVSSDSIVRVISTFHADQWHASLPMLSRRHTWARSTYDRSSLLCRACARHAQMIP
jgi:hypothetical protein